MAGYVRYDGQRYHHTLERFPLSVSEVSPNVFVQQAVVYSTTFIFVFFKIYSFQIFKSQLYEGKGSRAERGTGVG